MSKSLLRIIAFLLVPCLLTDPATATAFVPNDCLIALRGLSTSREIFSEQAIIQTFYDSGREINPTEDAALKNQAAQASRLTRRELLLRPVRAAVTAGAATMTLRIAALEQSIQAESHRESRKPLIFPHAIVPYDQLPSDAAVKKIIHQIDKRIRDFQQRTFQFTNDGTLRLMTSSQQGYEAEANEFAAGLATQFELMLDDMGTRGLITAAEKVVLRKDLAKALAAQKQAQFMWQEFFPRYFAGYGLYFNYDFVHALGLSIPAIEIRPVKNIEEITDSPPALDGETVPIQLIHLEKSLVSGPWDFNPAFFNQVATYATQKQSRQVFVRENRVTLALDTFIKDMWDMVKRYPQLLKGKPLTAREEPDPLLRARASLLARSLTQLAGTSPTTQSEERLRTILGQLYRIRTLHHETIHVHDYKQGGRVRADAELEARGDIGESIGTEGAALFLASDLAHYRYVDQESLSQLHHGLDVFYTVNRTAYWLWKDATLRNKLGITLPPFVGVETSVHQLSDLPHDIQVAVWDKLGSLDDKALREIYRHMWDEMQSPENPFTRGLDTKPLTYADASPEGRPTNASPPLHGLEIAASLSALVAIGSGAILFFHYHKRMQIRQEAEAAQLQQELGSKFRGNDIPEDVLAALVTTLRNQRSFEAIFKRALSMKKLSFSVDGPIKRAIRAGDDAMSGDEPFLNKKALVFLWILAGVALVTVSAYILQVSHLIDFHRLFASARISRNFQLIFVASPMFVFWRKIFNRGPSSPAAPGLSSDETGMGWGIAQLLLLLIGQQERARLWSDLAAHLRHADGSAERPYSTNWSRLMTNIPATFAARKLVRQLVAALEKQDLPMTMKARARKAKFHLINGLHAGIQRYNSGRPDILCDTTFFQRLPMSGKLWIIGHEIGESFLFEKYMAFEQTHPEKDAARKEFFRATEDVADLVGVLSARLLAGEGPSATVTDLDFFIALRAKEEGSKKGSGIHRLNGERVRYMEALKKFSDQELLTLINRCLAADPTELAGILNAAGLPYPLEPAAFVPAPDSTPPYSQAIRKLVRVNPSIFRDSSRKTVEWLKDFLDSIGPEFRWDEDPLKSEQMRTIFEHHYRDGKLLKDVSGALGLTKSVNTRLKDDIDFVLYHAAAAYLLRKEVNGDMRVLLGLDVHRLPLDELIFRALKYAEIKSVEDLVKQLQTGKRPNRILPRQWKLIRKRLIAMQLFDPAAAPADVSINEQIHSLYSEIRARINKYLPEFVLPPLETALQDPSLLPEGPQTLRSLYSGGHISHDLQWALLDLLGAVKLGVEEDLLKSLRWAHHETFSKAGIRRAA